MSFKHFFHAHLKEARFSSIENDITAPEITPVIWKWIQEMRKTHDLPRREKSFRQLAKRENAILLGELQIGRKTVRIWIQEMDSNGYWVERPKRASYILISLDLMIRDPRKALSTIVHEIIHGVQEYREQSDEYNIAAAKSGDETEEEMFHYFTEPKEVEAQLGQLGHEVADAYRRKRNKTSWLQALEHVLRTPRAAFQGTEWLRHPNMDVFRSHWGFLRSISAPPAGLQHSSRARHASDKCWRQFKQKLFTLMQQLKDAGH